MIRDKKYKYVHRYSCDKNELYDMENDPDEERNLIDSPCMTDIALTMSKRMKSWFANYSDPDRDALKEGVTGNGQMDWSGSRGYHQWPEHDTTKGEILNLESLESLGIICLLPIVIFIGLGWAIGNYIQERKFVKAGIWCGIVFGFIQPFLVQSIEPLSAFYESLLGFRVSGVHFEGFLLWPIVCLIYPAIGAFIGYAFSRMKEGDDK